MKFYSSYFYKKVLSAFKYMISYKLFISKTLIFKFKQTARYKVNILLLSEQIPIIVSDSIFLFCYLKNILSQVIRSFFRYH